MKPEAERHDSKRTRNVDLMHADQHEHTQSYLLRLWHSAGDGSCRALLQSIKTGERHMFGDLESLLAFLVDQAQPLPPA